MNRLEGKRFGRLLVIKRDVDHIQPSGQIRPQWLCRCDCGNTNIIVQGRSLTSGTTISCGCYRSEQISSREKKYNKYNLKGDYGIGYTTKDEPFYFDLEDYEKIKNYCWRYGKDGYIIAYSPLTTKVIRMHRLIIDCPVNKDPDHIHHIHHDNRKAELRIVTDSQNQMNELISKSNTSGYKGISWDKNCNMWNSYIMVNRKRTYKYFVDKGAAIAYRKILEERYHGEYALKEVSAQC